ncbi:MAG: Ribosomal small subunit methyltransferase [Pseudomonadota bacterium]
MTVADASSLPHLLRAGLADLGLTLTDTQIEQLISYQDLIAKWNRVYNLTAVRDATDMLYHHLLDSLAVVPLLRRQLETVPKPAYRLLDVGAGAGLPGVVLAICLPELRVSCVDTVGKKTAFIQQVGSALGLPNLKAIHARVETLDSAHWDVVCSRAFATLTDFSTWSRAALAPGGVWLAMKGKHPADELAALPADVEVFHVEQLSVPGLAAERCLVWLRPR